MTESELGPRQRAAETKKRRTREMIILSTLDLYGEMEQGDFTRDEITAAAGVGAATLHNHFRLKYDVLRAAHERLLSPVIEPITTAYIEGTYDPPDPVADLVRYVHAVAKVSHDHRALTVAMVRAFYEVAPENRPELLTAVGEDVSLDKHLAGHIVAGLLPILDGEPFLSGNGRYVDGVFDNGISLKTALYHSNGLLLNLYHSASPSTPIDVTHDVCSELLCATAPTIDLSILQLHLDQFRKKKELLQQVFKRAKTKPEERIFYMELLGDGHIREWQEGDESGAWGGEWKTYLQGGRSVLEVVVGDSSSPKFTTKFTVESEGLVGIEKSADSRDGETKVTLQFIDAGLDPEGWMQRVHAWSGR